MDVGFVATPDRLEPGPLALRSAKEAGALEGWAATAATWDGWRDQTIDQAARWLYTEHDAYAASRLARRDGGAQEDELSDALRSTY